MVKDVPVLNFFYGLNKIRKTAGSDGVHPALKTRYDSVLRQMEYDLEHSDLPPKAKKDLQRQVDNLKRYGTDIFEKSDNDNIGTQMYKAHLRGQATGYWERKGMDEADKTTAPDKLEERVRVFYKKKGWFK
jgi:hypothetical protein